MGGRFRWPTRVGPWWQCGGVTIGVTEALPPRAALLGEELLAPLGRRWQHVQGVAERAGFLAQLADREDRPSVVAAAWLHDIGYAPALVVTGLHPMDGVRYLRERGWPELVVGLVAHHTGAEAEAEERGLTQELREFLRPAESLLDLVTMADLTTSPAGRDVDPAQRIAEILRHYAPDDPVHRAVTRSAPSLLAVVKRVSGRLWQARLTRVGSRSPAW
jgi:HD domain